MWGVRVPFKSVRLEEERENQQLIFWSCEKKGKSVSKGFLACMKRKGKKEGETLKNGLDFMRD